MKKILGLIPVPAALQPQSTVEDLQARLKWGEPALTILDVRDRDSFYVAHIEGSIHVPSETLVEQAKAYLSPVRDLYVYGASDEETGAAAEQLRQAGFDSVAELKGGLKAWTSAGYPVEKVA